MRRNEGTKREEWEERDTEARSDSDDRNPRWQYTNR